MSLRPELFLNSSHSHSLCIFLSQTRHVYSSGELWVTLFSVHSTVKSPVCYSTLLSTFPRANRGQMTCSKPNHHTVAPYFHQSSPSEFSNAHKLIYFNSQAAGKQLCKFSFSSHPFSLMYIPAVFHHDICLLSSRDDLSLYLEY